MPKYPDLHPVRDIHIPLVPESPFSSVTGMEKAGHSPPDQPQIHQGPFVDTCAPLVVGYGTGTLECGPRCRHARSRSCCVAALSAAKTAMGVILVLCIGSIMLGHLGSSGVRGTVMGHFRGVSRHGADQCSQGRKWYHLKSDATFVRAMYSHSSATSEFLSPDNPWPTSANATFTLDMLNGLNVQVPPGVNAEIVISRSDPDVRWFLPEEGKIVLETFRNKGEEKTLWCTGMWKDRGDSEVDQLYIEPLDASAFFHRIHITLPSDPSIPVPPLYTNLPLRLYPAAVSGVSFTSLGITAHNRDVVGKYNVSKQIMFSSHNGDLDVDIWIVPSSGHQGVEPKGEDYSQALPGILAQTHSGSIDIRIHPSEPDDVYAHPVQFDVRASSGDILITDPTFLGAFQVAAHHGEATIEVTDGDAKEVEESARWGGSVVGEVRDRDHRGRGMSELRAMSHAGDVEIVF